MPTSPVKHGIVMAKQNTKQKITKLGRTKMMAYLRKKTGAASFNGYCPSTVELLNRCESHFGLTRFAAATKRERILQVLEAMGEPVAELKPKKKAKPKRRATKRKFDPFYTSERWMELRYRVLKANDGRCECCGRGKLDGVTLHVDHIKPRSKYPELQWEISNLQVLCAACNYGKRAWDETDWREPRLKVLMGEAME